MGLGSWDSAARGDHSAQSCAWSVTPSLYSILFETSTIVINCKKAGIPVGSLWGPRGGPGLACLTLASTLGCDGGQTGAKQPPAGEDRLCQLGKPHFADGKERLM